MRVVAQAAATSDAPVSPSALLEAGALDDPLVGARRRRELRG